MGYLPLSTPISRHNAQIGRFTVFSPDLFLRTWIPGEMIIIGKYCSIADRVTICTGGHHRTDHASLYAFDSALAYRGTKDTTIGNDVWIGSGAQIMGGAMVGDGSVVASRSVVFSDVAPFAIVAGNPAVLVRYRFSDAIVNRMLRIAWWHWPDEKLFTNIEWFSLPIAEFVEHFDPDGGDSGDA
jgi:acetyltransferase-like isoleucine patch superfamily enzyme